MKNSIFLVLSIVSAMSVVSCAGSQAGPSAPAKYETMTVGKSSETVLTSYAATLEGRQIVEVRPQVSGIITSINIDEGAPVRKGQVLFVINQVPYKAALEVAKANVSAAEAKLATAKLNVESNQALYEKDVISAYDLLSAQNTYAAAVSSYEQARAQVTIATNDLSYTEVRSPLDGVAGMIPWKVGALVGSSISEPLVTLCDDNVVRAYFSVSENGVRDIRAGQEDVRLLLSDGSEYGLKGKIDAISGMVEKSTGAVKVRASFENPGKELRSGGSATVVIPSTLSDCIVIPQGATFEIQEKVFVYKVKDGKAVSSEVKVHRLNNGKNYVVESGLEPGEVIIAKGAGLVKEGAAVAAAIPGSSEESRPSAEAPKK